MNEFQERLEELLIEKEMSRLQLAKTLGISSTTINGYFNKNYFPQIEIAIKMSKFFNCSLDYLFGFTDDKSQKYDIDIKEILNIFINNFISLSKENKLSIAKVMKDLHMSEYNFYRWKNGKFPKTINLISVAKYFEVSVDYLIGKRK